MSGSAWIVRRVKVDPETWAHSASAKPHRRGAVRWVVWYRLDGGRSARPRYAGTFKAREDAERRARAIERLLAEVPRPDIRAALAGPDGARTIAVLMDQTLETFPRPSTSLRKRFAQSEGALGWLGEMIAEDVTWRDVQRWINELAGRYAHATVQQYLVPVRQAIDHADLSRPNPARDRRLRLPAPEEDDYFVPPTWAEVQTILAAINPKYRELLTVIERTGLRIAEALRLDWRDVDFPRHRLRVLRTKRHTKGVRFIPLTPPIEELLRRLAAGRAPHASVFPGLTGNGVRGALRTACRRAGTAHFHPHDLRGRHISLMLTADVPVEVAARIAGHSKTSMTLDVYSHVVLDEPEWRLAELRRAVAVVFRVIIPDSLTPEMPANEGGETRVEDTGIGCGWLRGFAVLRRVARVAVAI